MEENKNIINELQEDKEIHKSSKDSSNILKIFIIALLIMIVVLCLITLNKVSSKNEIKEPNDNQIENNTGIHQPENNNNQSSQERQLLSASLFEDVGSDDYPLVPVGIGVIQDNNKLNKILSIISNKEKYTGTGGLGGALLPPTLELKYSDQTVKIEFPADNLMVYERELYIIQYEGSAYNEIKSLFLNNE